VSSRILSEAEDDACEQAQREAGRRPEAIAQDERQNAPHRFAVLGSGLLAQQPQIPRLRVAVDAVRIDGVPERGKRVAAAPESAGPVAVPIAALRTRQ